MNEPDHDGRWNSDFFLRRSEHIEEQSVGFLPVVKYPVTGIHNVTAIDNLLDILPQLDQTSLIVTSYNTRNQTGTSRKIQELG